MYIGLSKEDAVECFNFTKAPDTKLIPQIVWDENGVKFEKLIKESDTECFIINRITVNDGKYTLNVNGSYGVYIVTVGKGKISSEGYSKEIKKGDYFFMPSSLMNKFNIEGNIEIIECF